MWLTKPNTSLLRPLKDSFEIFLKRNIPRLGDENKLRNACEYALLNGGKRIRPLIVMMTARALGHGLDVFEACLSVEYFHTASLIADDLPCMDNDDTRRCKPALHKMYGETVALLASYALISAGYEKIFQSVQVLSRQKEPFRNRSNEACMVALDAATRCAGISGATGGQFKDLFPEERSLEAILDVIYKKTVTLFEIAFVFGWVFGGGPLDEIEGIRDAAFSFGMAFQIADDIGDVYQDDKESLNIAHFLGKEGAMKRFEEEIETFASKMKKLGMLNPEFQQTIDLLIDHAKGS
ncbi:polyprenyl synthetase family protein [Candidatus Neptunochlamydia vexilliferae]|uniref:polyprenyl synthetase family protein n=1 Tax=Candidatus Neptunichlamydia vexilliferae TaxID=1651774 RepID=UPI0018911B4A|nr:polyprenyl synthetase family protein [Candidatus Neptunochlamydia vexilliferae]